MHFHLGRLLDFAELLLSIIVKLYHHIFFRYLARSFTFILPYFPTGTMERVDKEGQIATAKVTF